MLDHRSKGFSSPRLCILCVFISGLFACSKAPLEATAPIRGGIARAVQSPSLNSTAPSTPGGAVRTGALNYLSAFVGKPAHGAKLWQTQPLRDRLLAMLGQDFERLLTSLSEAPLQMEGGTYFVTLQPAGRIAAVVMDPKSDTLYAIEQDQNGRREYLERGQKPELPASVTTLILSLPLR